MLILPVHRHSVSSKVLMEAESGLALLNFPNKSQGLPVSRPDMFSSWYWCRQENNKNSAPQSWSFRWLQDLTRSHKCPWFLRVRLGEYPSFLINLPRCVNRYMQEEELRKGCFWNLKTRKLASNVFTEDKCCWQWARSEDSMTFLNQHFTKADTAFSYGEQQERFWGQGHVCLNRMRKIWLNSRTLGELSQPFPWRRSWDFQHPI